MFYLLFEKMNLFFFENDLQYIVKDICFLSFMILYVEYFFVGMRILSCLMLDMYDYGSCRLSCIVEFVQKVYYFFFLVYMGF